MKGRQSLNRELGTNRQILAMYQDKGRHERTILPLSFQAAGFTAPAEANTPVEVDAAVLVSGE